MVWYGVNEIGVVGGVKGRVRDDEGGDSFGRLVVCGGVGIESMSKMMGDRNMKRSEVYGKVSDDKM